MKLTISLVYAALTILTVVDASDPHGRTRLSPRHGRISRRQDSGIFRRTDSTAKCKPNPGKEQAPAPPQPEQPPAQPPVQPEAPAQPANPQPTEQPSQNSTTPGQGLIGYADPRCGPSGATQDILTLSGPNGHIDFLNFGWEGAGWNPPHVSVEQLTYLNLADVVEKPLFAPCKPFVPLFEKHANANSIPPIMVAAFAMQESTCSQYAQGSDTEKGLMQLKERVGNCDGAPNGDCYDPDFNIGKGTGMFTTLLKKHGGNILLALGAYNNWSLGLTVGTGCDCSRNPNYLHSFLNGFCLGIAPHTIPMGKYHCCGF